MRVAKVDPHMDWSTHERWMSDAIVYCEGISTISSNPWTMHPGA
jgi:hypothetical protein